MDQMITWFLGIVGTLIGGLLLAGVARINRTVERIEERDVAHAKAQGICEARHEATNRRLERLERNAS